MSDIGKMAGNLSRLVVLLAAFCSAAAVIQGGMLHPRESESRQIQEMNGMWSFRADMSPSRDEGMTNKWYLRPLFEVSWDLGHVMCLGLAWLGGCEWTLSCDCVSCDWTVDVCVLLI